MNTSMAIQILPQGVDQAKLLHVVDQVIEYIKASQMTYHVGPFETTVEGDFDQVMQLLKDCQRIAIEEGAPSLMTYIKIHYQPKGDLLSIDEKITKYQ